MAVQRTEQMARRARNILAHSQGLESKKNSGGRRGIFLDFTFYRTYQDLARATVPQSKSSDVERVRLASISAVNSATLCSAVAMASAPAINLRGGGCWSAITISAFASLAGSPDCLPFWAFQNSSCFVLCSS